MSKQKKSKLDEFLFALIYLTDERSKGSPRAEVIDSWYTRAQVLFAEAISEAVKSELEAIELEVIVRG